MSELEDQILASYNWASHYAEACAARFSFQHDREELKSIGIYGYIVAASRYDKGLGTSFRGYCASRIHGAIMDELRRSNWEPRSAWRNQLLIAQTQETLEAELGRSPTSAELAERFGLSEIEFVQMERISRPARFVSLDADYATGPDTESLPLKETIPDQSAAVPSKAAELADIRHNLLVSISRLSSIEATVVVLYYLRNIPFHEIAQALQLTPSRISQVHHRALHSLKKILGEKNMKVPPHLPG